MIDLRHVSKTFQTKNKKIQAVKDVSLSIVKGDIYGIIGYSGAGKSTLVRCINLLERPTSGQVLVGGVDLMKISSKELRQERKKIGMIFQHFNLFASRSVYENIAYPLKGRGLSKEDEAKKIGYLLKLVGLEDRGSAYPSELSGGQKQRVAIARALATDPEVLLCDEATSALDPKTTKSILKLLKDLNNKLGLTIVIITHEMGVIKEICNKVSIMEDGEVIESGTTVKIFSEPSRDVTREFLDTDSNRNKILEILKMDKNIFDIRAGDVLARVAYLGDSTGEALISKISNNYKLEASILYGNLEILGQTPVGEMILLFKGEENKIQLAIDYLREKGLIVEVLEHGRDTREVYTKCN